MKRLMLLLCPLTLLTGCASSDGWGGWGDFFSDLRRDHMLVTHDFTGVQNTDVDLLAKKNPSE
jgi:hypothetical protein